MVFSETVSEENEGEVGSNTAGEADCREYGLCGDRSDKQRMTVTVNARYM